MKLMHSHRSNTPARLPPISMGDEENSEEAESGYKNGVENSNDAGFSALGPHSFSPLSDVNELPNSVLLSNRFNRSVSFKEESFPPKTPPMTRQQSMSLMNYDSSGMTQREPIRDTVRRGDKLRCRNF